MKRIHLYLLTCFIFVACAEDKPNLENFQLDEIHHSENYVFNINTTRSVGNILTPQTITRAVDADPFTEIREVECFESVVLPELQPHIWIGNILTKGSVANCIYKPLIYPRVPITISLTLPGTSSSVVESPSYSKYLTYIQDQIDHGTFVQNDEFNFTVEQFVSYNELKAAFGSNVNTNGLFWHSSTSSSSTDHLINKATGLYVKFYQTSFKAIMDYPNTTIASIPEDKIDSAVYINSITYGRLGILTLETNESVYVAQDRINKIFKTIFYSNSSSFSKDEQNFLNGCEFKIYLIGGNGSTSVESFSGLDGFIRHIKKGTFNKNEPGTPIFCTFNHVRDNSPVSVNFKYSIKKEPLYVELVHKPTEIPEFPTSSGVYGGGGYSSYSKYTKLKGWGELYVYFYRNKAKVPTIASPIIPIKVIEKHTTQSINKSGTAYNRETCISAETSIKNAGYQTSACVGWPSLINKGGRRAPGSVDTVYYSTIFMYGYVPKSKTRFGDNIDAFEEYYEYYIEESDDYVILNNVPLNADNCPLSRKG